MIGWEAVLLWILSESYGVIGYQMQRMTNKNLFDEEVKELDT